MNGPIEAVSLTPQPLILHKLFAASNSEKVSERLSQHYNDTDVLIRPVESKGRLAHELYAVPIGSMTLTSLAWPFGVRAESPCFRDAFEFCISIDGKCEVSVGKEQLESNQHHGFVLAPNRPMRVVAKTRHTFLNVKVPQRLMEEQLRATTGRDTAAPLEFAPTMALSRQPLAGVWQLVRWLAQEVGQDETVLSNPIVAARFCETVLTSLLYSQQHNYSQWLVCNPTAAAPRYVRLAQEYLEAHSAEAISMPDLAETAGVSLSALYAGFRRYRGCTPLEFLRDLRLTHVG